MQSPRPLSDLLFSTSAEPDNGRVVAIREDVLTSIANAQAELWKDSGGGMHLIGVLHPDTYGVLVKYLHETLGMPACLHPAVGLESIELMGMRIYLATPDSSGRFHVEPGVMHIYNLADHLDLQLYGHCP